MRMPGFFDLEERFAKLDGLGDPLVKIAEVVDWEGFRSALNRAFSKPRKGNAGRKEYDRVLMFKVLVLQQLYNLSDEQAEYQIRDRYTFGRFLGLHPEDRVPDARTIWRFREGLKSSGGVRVVVRRVVVADREAGLCRAQGPDRGCEHRGGAPPAEYSRGQRQGQKRRSARGLVVEQASPQGCGSALDAQAWREPLRVQEPHQHGPGVWTGPMLGGDGCGPSRQPGIGTGTGQEEHSW